MKKKFLFKGMLLFATIAYVQTTSARLDDARQKARDLELQAYRAADDKLQLRKNTQRGIYEARKTTWKAKRKRYEAEAVVRQNTEKAKQKAKKETRRWTDTVKNWFS